MLRYLMIVPVALAISSAVPSGAVAQIGIDDRHENYYYPELTSEETYPARGPLLPNSTKLRRIGFVVGFTNEQLQRPFPPQFALFAKGAEAEKVILTSLHNGAFDTLFQARGFLAQLTAVARNSAVFRDLKVVDTYTFYDLLAILGFEQVTVTNGRDWAHRVTIERYVGD